MYNCVTLFFDLFTKAKVNFIFYFLSFLLLKNCFVQEFFLNGARNKPWQRFSGGITFNIF
ncbi:hypothetical protein EGT74_06900 [Chitinophaga lutea]|uniref:Uncharacterized protein n=1 Tax=Chitinophaga lutea TaxID=2488634 RepID=A0A3N4Q6U1_9BACT|nr:hypothetical protein EGT74_06900 [Chitinophaga lutea]